MNSEQYKELSIKEFTKAAEIYDSDHAGIYEMCRDDYPPILEELKKIKFDNLLDVVICANSFHHYPNLQNFCDEAGLSVVTLEKQKKFRLHLVAEKKNGE